MKYRRVFTHPEIGRLDGKLYDGLEGLVALRELNRDVARGDVVYQTFACADGREIWLNAARLAEGLLWIEPVEEGELPTPPKQFREGAAGTAV